MRGERLVVDLIAINSSLIGSQLRVRAGIFREHSGLVSAINPGLVAVPLCVTRGKGEPIVDSKANLRFRVTGPIKVHNAKKKKITGKDGIRENG